MNKLTNIITLVLFSNTMRTYISNTWSVFYITDELRIRYSHIKTILNVTIVVAQVKR